MKKEQCGIFPAAGASARWEPRGAAECGAFVWAVLYATLRFAHRFAASVFAKAPPRQVGVHVYYLLVSRGQAPCLLYSTPSGVLTFAAL